MFFPIIRQTYHLFERFLFYFKQNYGKHPYSYIFLKIIFTDQISNRRFTPRTSSKVLIPFAKLLSKKLREFIPHSRVWEMPISLDFVDTECLLHTYSDDYQINRQKDIVLLIYLVISIFFLSELHLHITCIFSVVDSWRSQ